MKIWKSQSEITTKRDGGMDTDEEVASYQQYKKLSKNPSGDEGDVLLIEDMYGKSEAYYCWVFYSEDPDGLQTLPKYVEKHLKEAKKDKPCKFHFNDKMQQERYEWFCGGWVQFYDDILRPEEIGGIEHKIFFYWDRTDRKGVAIYVNDKNAVDNNYQIQLVYDKAKRQLTYTAPPARTADPPVVPPPPPPSKT